MIWIALLVVVALVAGVLGTVLELALWALALVVLAVLAGGLLLSRTAGRRSPAGRS